MLDCFSGVLSFLRSKQIRAASSFPFFIFCSELQTNPHLRWGAERWSTCLRLALCEETHLDSHRSFRSWAWPQAGPAAVGRCGPHWRIASRRVWWKGGRGQGRVALAATASFSSRIACSAANVVEIQVKICSFTAISTLSPANCISESLCIWRGTQDSWMSNTNVALSWELWGECVSGLCTGGSQVWLA